MRFSEPSIESGLRALTGDGATTIVAIILSPQYSPLLMRGYAQAIDDACAAIGDGGPRCHGRRRLARGAGVRHGPGRTDPRRRSIASGRMRADRATSC